MIESKTDLFKNYFNGKRVLITGGLGFIGSNLAIQLVKCGAEITIVDNMLPNHGGNIFNINPVKDKIHLNYGDISSVSSMNYIVRDQDIIFHLAGQVSHVLSLKNPYPDIEINIKGTAILMDACKNYNPDVKIIYTSTRGVYGSVAELPVSEKAPTHPKGIHEISSLTAEKIIKVYNDIHGIDAIILRLTNIFGPRAQMLHHHFGVANWFIRLAIENQIIQVFGDGSILRDFLYIDDCVNAILTTAVTEKCNGETYNIGDTNPRSFLELVKTIIEIAGSGSLEFAPFSPERKAQEPGNFYSDISKVKEHTGWMPSTSLQDGLAETINFYKQYKKHYWNQ